ncbi:SRPBCC family protein [Aquirhabdus parva]|nr:SRPBCC family protein [Aquirhabdus parva]
MARARNIKPSFFMNDKLVELCFAARLLFIGLWTLADCEGYLEDRPKRIKMSLFPADQLDVDALLGDLATAGFIHRYKVAGVRYIHVVNFSKHQNPHHKEALSVIPKPVSQDEDVAVRDDAGSGAIMPINKDMDSAMDMGHMDMRGGLDMTEDNLSHAPVLPRANLGHASVLPQTDPADSLIPDSLNLIPDSLIPDSHDASLDSAIHACSHRKRAAPNHLKSSTLRRISPALLSLGLASVLLTSAHADTPKFVSWNDPTPSALQPFDGNPDAVADMAGQSLFFYPQARKTITLPYTRGPKSYANVQYYTGAIVVSASPDQVAKALSDFSGYQKLFPKMTESTVQAQEGDVNDPNGSVKSIVKYHLLIKIPFPFLTFDEDVLIQHERKNNSISTLILKSSIQYGTGRFEWFPLKNGKTLVTLTQWGDLDHPVGFLVSTVLSAMPEIKQAIPSGIEGFVLESLRQRFNPDTQQTPLPLSNIVPTMTMTSNQEATLYKLLQQGGTVQFSHRPVWLATAVRPEKLYFVSSFYHMPASLDQMKEAFATPKNFPEIYRQVRKVTSTPLADGSTQNDVKIALGLGILSIPMHLNLIYKAESELATRLYSTGGDIEFVQGRITLKPTSNKTTLVNITAGGKLGEHPPFLLKLGKSLPYYDYLSTAGTAPVIFEKARVWVSKK